jgi:hypothetical protein
MTARSKNRLPTEVVFQLELSAKRGRWHVGDYWKWDGVFKIREE